MEKRTVLMALISLMILFNLLAILSLFSYSSQERISPVITGAPTLGGVSIMIEGPSQAIPLVQGWNFISFYLGMSNYSIDQAFSSINGYYDYVLQWNSSSQEFNTWSSAGSRQFTVLNNNKSYFVYMNQAKNLSISGPYYGNKTIVLVNGWESPNYIYEFSSNVTNKTFYNMNFSYMQKWNVSSQEFIVYSPISTTKPFDKVFANEGYFMLTAGGNLTYVRTQ